MQEKLWCCFIKENDHVQHSNYKKTLDNNQWSILFFLEVVCLKVYKLQTLYQTAGITLLENIAPANVESKQATGFHMYAKQPMETLAENYQANL